VTLCLNGPLHSFLDGLMSPAKTPFRRTGHLDELSGFEPVGELRLHHLSDGRLAHSAGTGNQEQHRSSAQHARPNDASGD